MLMTSKNKSTPKGNSEKIWKDDNPHVRDIEHYTRYVV